MKNVLSSTYDVASAWAEQKQNFARVSSRSIYFENETIYSYGSHFPIARIIAPMLALFTTRSYSMSTAKHICRVSSALLHFNMNRIRVENVEAESAEDHALNIEALNENIKELFESASRANKRVKFAFDYAKEAIANRRRYIKFFSLPFKYYRVNMKILAKINEKIRKLESALEV